MSAWRWSALPPLLLELGMGAQHTCGSRGLLFLLWELGLKATEAGSRKKQKRLGHSVCEFTQYIHVT